MWQIIIYWKSGITSKCTEVDINNKEDSNEWVEFLSSLKNIIKISWRKIYAE